MKPELKETPLKEYILYKYNHKKFETKGKRRNINVPRNWLKASRLLQFRLFSAFIGLFAIYNIAFRFCRIYCGYGNGYSIKISHLYSPGIWRLWTHMEDIHGHDIVELD